MCEKLTAQGESKEAVNSASYEVEDSHLHVASEHTDGGEEGIYSLNCITMTVQV